MPRGTWSPWLQTCVSPVAWPGSRPYQATPCGMVHVAAARLSANGIAEAHTVGDAESRGGSNARRKTTTVSTTHVAPRSQKPGRVGSGMRTPRWEVRRGLQPWGSLVPAALTLLPVYVWPPTPQCTPALQLVLVASRVRKQLRSTGWWRGQVALARSHWPGALLRVGGRLSPTSS